MATRGDFLLTLRASTRGFNTQIRSARDSYKSLITVMKQQNELLRSSMRQLGLSVDGFKKNLGQTQNQAARFSATLKALSLSAVGAKAAFGALARTNKNLGANLLNVAFALGIAKQAFGAMTSSARELETGLAKVATVLETKDLPVLNKFQKGLERMSVQFGRSTGELSEGLFEILQASIPPSQALEFLEKSTKLAIGGFTDIRTAAKLAASVIKAFGKDAGEVEEVMDILFTTQRKGITTIEELAGSLGTILPVANIVGISFREVSAAIAALSRQGIKTSEAVTSLNRFLLSFVKNTKEGREAARALGFELNSATLRTLGIAGAIRKLSDEAADLDLIAKIFPRITAVKGAAGLLQVVNELEEDLDTSFKNVEGSAERAFEQVFNTADEQLKRLKETVKLVFSDFFGPALDSVSSGSAKAADNILSIRKAVLDVRLAVGKFVLEFIAAVQTIRDFILIIIDAIRTNAKGLALDLVAIFVNQATRMIQDVVNLLLQGFTGALNTIVNLVNALRAKLGADPLPLVQIPQVGQIIPELPTPAIDKLTKRLKFALAQFREFQQGLATSVERQRVKALKDLNKLADGAEAAGDRMSGASKRTKDSIEGDVRDARAALRNLTDAINKTAKESEDALNKEAKAFRKLRDEAIKAAAAAKKIRGKLIDESLKKELKAIDRLDVAESQKLGFRLNALAEFIKKMKEAGQDTSKLEEEFNDLRRMRAEAIAKDIEKELENSTNRQIEMLKEQLDNLKAQANDIEKTASERAASQRKADKIERQLELEKLRQRRFDTDKFFNDEDKALRKARARGQITEQEFIDAQERSRRGRIATELEALSEILDKEVLSEGERAKVEKRRRGLAVRLAKERLDQINKEEGEAEEALKKKAKDEGFSNKERKDAEKALGDEFDKRREEAVDEFLRKTGKAREVKAIEAAKKEGQRALDERKDGLDEAEKAQRRAEAQVDTFGQVLRDIAEAIAGAWKEAADAIRKAAEEAEKALGAAGGAVPLPGAPGAEEPDEVETEIEKALKRQEEANEAEARARELLELARKESAEADKAFRAADPFGRQAEAERAASAFAREAALEKALAAALEEQARAREGVLRATGRKPDRGFVPTPGPRVPFSIDAVDPFGRRAPAGTTPSKTVDGLAAKLDEIIRCVCKKTGIDESVVRQNVMIRIQNDFTLTGSPEDIDLERLTDKISRKLSDHLIDDVGLPPTSAFTGD